MGNGRMVGKYQLGKTIGEGTFAKVKLAKNATDDHKVAIKIIDKQMIIASNLMYQVQREIRTMKRLNHPNIVRIHEVIATKTKIYIVMEHVAGGRLSDKLSYSKPLSEEEARKYFQQLIDAVEYCHCRGVYHRDLKPENLLLDNKGNIKVSDFGLSALHKPGSLLQTACGSPCYVAPELLRNKGYEGAAADVWTCGVILFEMLGGYLPFDDNNLLNLYRKILGAAYECPQWFTPSQKKLISRMFNRFPDKRITIAEIIEDEWFQVDYKPALGIEFEEKGRANNVQADLDSAQEVAVDKIIPQTPQFINAFKLISVLRNLDLSGMFEEQDDKKRIILGSKFTISETIRKIEMAARDASLSVERMNSCKVKILSSIKSKCRSCFDLLAEVTEVAPTDCVVEISKYTGELGTYLEFCRRLSSLLIEESGRHQARHMSKDDSISSKKAKPKAMNVVGAASPTETIHQSDSILIRRFQSCSLESPTDSKLQTRKIRAGSCRSYEKSHRPHQNSTNSSSPELYYVLHIAVCFYGS